MTPEASLAETEAEERRGLGSEPVGGTCGGTGRP